MWQLILSAGWDLNLHRNTPEGVPVSVLPERINWEGQPTLIVGSIMPQAGILGWRRWRKEAEYHQPSFPACWCSVSSQPPMRQNQPSFNGCLGQEFCRSNKKVTNMLHYSFIYNPCIVKANPQWQRAVLTAAGAEGGSTEYLVSLSDGVQLICILLMLVDARVSMFTKH